MAAFITSVAVINESPKTSGTSKGISRANSSCFRFRSEFPRLKVSLTWLLKLLLLYWVPDHLKFCVPF